MEMLMGIGAFLGGLGMLLLSFAVFWFTSVYQKVNEKNSNNSKKLNQ
jgi:cbb3-type cytochrome oxidase subunit 3